MIIQATSATFYPTSAECGGDDRGTPLPPISQGVCNRFMGLGLRDRVCKRFIPWENAAIVCNRLILRGLSGRHANVSVTDSFLTEILQLFHYKGFESELKKARLDEPGLSHLSIYSLFLF
jgi:hypothetical protein